MKKIYTLLVIALLVPTFAFAAPKKKITIPFLQKQISYLAKENKALRTELETLKALQNKTSTELNYCKANPSVLERVTTTQQVVPVMVTSSSYVAQSVLQPQEQRKLKIFASPVTDGVEVNGVETMLNVRFQIQSTLDTDTIELTGATILDQYNEGGGKIFILSPESALVTLTVNGKATNTNIVVEDSPDKNNNSNKRVYLTGAFEIEA